MRKLSLVFSLLLALSLLTPMAATASHEQQAYSLQDMAEAIIADGVGRIMAVQDHGSHSPVIIIEELHPSSVTLKGQ